MRIPFSIRIVAASILVPALASAMGTQVIIEGRTVTFVDVPQNAWFAEHVRAAAEAGIVNGYKDTRGNLTGKFGPGNSITLAEALKIASEGAGYDEQLYGSMIDGGVGKHWAAAYMSVAKAERFEVFRSPYRFDQPATRAQVASIFASAFGIDTAQVSPVDSRYTDVRVSTTYAASIEALSRDEVLSGDTDIDGQATGTFRPGEPINRAEVAKMVIRARAVYGTPGAGKTPEQAESEVKENVEYTDNGFSPAVLHVKKGDTVEFHNASAGQLWVASDPHPTHTNYSGFDAKASTGPGGTYVFTFTRIGTFGYHNHMNPSMGGTIIVEE